MLDFSKPGGGSDRVARQIHLSALPRQEPILPSKTIKSETPPDLSWSVRYAAISVAEISTRNLSALVSQAADADLPIMGQSEFLQSVILQICLIDLLR